MALVLSVVCLNTVGKFEPQTQLQQTLILRKSRKKLLNGF